MLSVKGEKRRLKVRLVASSRQSKHIPTPPFASLLLPSVPKNELMIQHQGKLTCNIPSLAVAQAEGSSDPTMVHEDQFRVSQYYAQHHCNRSDPGFEHTIVG